MNSPIHLKEEKTPRSHESIFLEHYDWLLDRAGHLVAGTPEDPKELVQELYIHFVQLKAIPDFDDHVHIQGYLRKALRNLFASRRMRHGRDATTRLTLVDFDSLETALAAVDRSQLFNVRSDLARISEYILLRRATNKGATVFIMRFFFDFLPSEIQQILKLNRKHFERMLRAARLEAKAYVERPHVLRILDRRDRNAPSFPSTLPEDTAGLFAELQRRMLFEQVGDHRLLHNVEEVYSASSGPLTIEQTAHLGSCRLCLHQAGQFLNIPDLLLQLFPDAAEPGDPTSGSRGTESDRLKKLRRKGRENYEHRPSQLQIIVDGQLRGVQTITSAESSLQLTLKPLSKPEFVEIRSEQGVPMLYCDLQDSAEMLETREVRAEFSEGRMLSASFHFTDGAPVIELYYHDPLLEYPEDENPLENDVHVAPTGSQGISSPRRLVSLGSFGRWIAEVVRYLPGGRWGGVAAFAFALFAAGFFIKSERTPIPLKTVPAGQQLLSASQQNSQMAIPDGGGTHAIYTLDCHSISGAGVNSERVEVIRSKLAKQFAFRLRSSSGDLLGVRTSDKNEATPEAGHLHRGTHNKGTSTPSSVWTHVPDIQDFLHLAGNASITVSSTPSGYDLGFHRTDAPIDGVVEGHIELAGPNLHPVSENLHVQDADTESTYRFVEVSYTVLSAEEFRRQNLNQEENTTTASHRRQDENSAASSLALHALQILDDSRDAEDAIDLERLPDGVIHLSGVLPTDLEKSLLIRKLRALPGGTQLSLDIHSSQEVSASNASGGLGPHSDVISVEAIQQTVPWIELLRTSSSREAALSHDERDAINRTARLLVSGGARFHREVWFNAGLASRWFTVRELRSFSHDDQVLWASLVWRHLSSAESTLQDVIRVLNSQSTDIRDSGPLINDVATFARESERLLQDSERLDRLLSTGFAVSTSQPPSTAESSELLPLLSATRQQESELIHVVESLR